MPAVQDEINQQTVAFMIRGSEMTLRIFRQAIREYLNRKQQLYKTIDIKTSDTLKSGKQSLKSMKEQGAQLSTVKISEENIGDFERFAKKYEIDYSLKRDRDPEHPCYIVFFKVKDVDLLDAAFREYAADFLDEDEQKKDPLPLRQRIEERKRERKNKERQPREKYKELEEISR